MRLSKNNFSKSTCLFGKPYGDKKEGVVYSYETSKALYDVLILDGSKYYQTNSGGYSDRIDSIHNIHKAIEKHYNL